MAAPSFQARTETIPSVGADSIIGHSDPDSSGSLVFFRVTRILPSHGAAVTGRPGQRESVPVFCWNVAIKTVIRNSIILPELHSMLLKVTVDDNIIGSLCRALLNACHEFATHRRSAACLLSSIDIRSEVNETVCCPCVSLSAGKVQGRAAIAVHRVDIAFCLC